MNTILIQWLAISGLSAGFLSPTNAQDLQPLQGINYAISQAISQSASPGEVQIATLPALVQWNNEGGRYAFYQLCDVLSSWGPEIRSSEIKLSNRYLQYLLGIQAKQGDPVANATQKKLAVNAADEEIAFEKEQEAVLKDWDRRVALEKNVPEANKTAYSTFMLKRGAKLASLRISAFHAYGLWHPYAAKAGPSSVGYALGQLLNPGSLVKVKTYSGAELNVHECSPSIDIKQELANAEKIVAAKSKPALVLSYGKRTGKIDESWQKWGGGGGWGPFSASASGAKSNISTNSNNFKLLVEIPVIIRFPITRPWLDFSIIQTYKDTTIIPDSELDELRPLFGEKGSFSLVPIEFIAAYKPRVSITMDKADYKTARSNYTAGGGLSIGPFHVNANASGGSSVETWDDENSTVVIGSNADSFVLLGVRNRVLP